MGANSLKAYNVCNGIGIYGKNSRLSLVTDLHNFLQLILLKCISMQHLIKIYHAVTGIDTIKYPSRPGYHMKSNEHLQ